MLLAVAGKQKFLRLRVAIKAKRPILFENLVQRRTETIFIVPALSRNRVCDGRLRH